MGAEFRWFTVPALTTGVLTVAGLGAVAISAARVGGVTVGQAGVVFAAGKTYTVSLRAKADAPRKINVTLSQVTQKPNDVLTEAAGLAVVYRLNRWLRAVGSYHFTHSESGGQATYHSLVSVGLQARYPTRLDD